MKKNTMQYNTPLTSCQINTPLGPMLGIGDDEVLYLLEFADRQNLTKRIEKLKQITKKTITPGQTMPLVSIALELKQYFECQLTTFTTPITLFGTPFQLQVWKALQHIPFGQKSSYKEIAIAIGNPKGCRAVAQANKANRLGIIVPCHRIINADESCGGYSGGIWRKKLLIDIERKNLKICTQGN